MVYTVKVIYKKREYHSICKPNNSNSFHAEYQIIDYCQQEHSDSATSAKDTDPQNSYYCYAEMVKIMFKIPGSG